MLLFQDEQKNTWIFFQKKRLDFMLFLATFLNIPANYIIVLNTYTYEIKAYIEEWSCNDSETATSLQLAVATLG